MAVNRKVLYLFLLVCFVSACVTTNVVAEEEVKNSAVMQLKGDGAANFGMSKSDVEEILGEPVDSSPILLIYNDEFSYPPEKVRVKKVYSFVNDELDTIALIFEYKKQQDSMGKAWHRYFFQVFDTTQKALLLKYGDPTHYDDVITSIGAQSIVEGVLGTRFERFWSDRHSWSIDEMTSRWSFLDGTLVHKAKRDNEQPWGVLHSITRKRKPPAAEEDKTVSDLLDKL